MRARALQLTFGIATALTSVGACFFGSAVGPCGGDVCRDDECCLQACGGVDPSDVCVAVRMDCTEGSAPVCGCDGHTYDDACEAHRACVAVAHEGACGSPSVD